MPAGGPDGGESQGNGGGWLFQEFNARDRAISIPLGGIWFSNGVFVESSRGTSGARFSFFSQSQRPLASFFPRNNL